MKYKKQDYVRHSVSTDLSILQYVTNKRKGKDRVTILINDERVNLSTLRLLCFKEKGLKCVVCETVGTYFALERSYKTPSYHLNLYGIDADGDEVLMTKDHIIPKSKGGLDSITNMQTMCICCNHDKGDE